MLKVLESRSFVTQAI